MGIVWETYHTGVPENTLDSNSWEKVGCLNHQLTSLPRALLFPQSLSFFCQFGSRGHLPGEGKLPLHWTWPEITKKKGISEMILAHEGHLRWWQLKDFWNFHPENWERIPNFDEHIFRRGWLKPPTRSWNATNFWGSGSTYMVIVPYNIGGAIVVARFF